MSASNRDSDPFGWVGLCIGDKYRVDSVAATGGFGVVYRGQHLGLDVPIAIKCLKLGKEGPGVEPEVFLPAAQREAQLLYRLSGLVRHVVRAFDFAADTAPNGEWTPYVIMEWLEGETLEVQLCARERAGLPPLSPSAVVRLLAPAAEALAIAHAEGIAHRDVKPNNLFLVHERGGKAIKVLDFGIAEVIDLARDPASRRVVEPGPRLGLTPEYAAPEQWDPARGETGPWTDVFALALVVIRTMSGAPALRGRTPAEYFRASCARGERPSLAARGVVGGAELDHVLWPALDVFPGARPTLREMWAALSEVAARTDGSVRSDRDRAPSVRPRSGGSVPPSEQSVSTEENRLCTVLWCSVDLPASAPAAIGALDALFNAFDGVVGELGGVGFRVLADRWMGVLGAQRSSGRDAERAVRAALELHGIAGRSAHGPLRLRRGAPALRVGVATGLAVVQAGASGPQAVLGRPILLAEALARAAPPGATWISAETNRHAMGRFYVHQVALQGARASDPTSVAYELEGVAATPLPLAPAGFFGLTTRMIGREQTLDRLVSVIDDVIARRRGRRVMLIGPPGIGRSRLLAEVATCLAMNEQRWHLLFSAEASPTQTQASYSFAAALLRARFHVHEDDSPHAVELKLRLGERLYLRRFDAVTAAHRREGSGSDVDGSSSDVDVSAVAIAEPPRSSSQPEETMPSPIVAGARASDTAALLELARAVGVLRSPSSSTGPLVAPSPGVLRAPAERGAQQVEYDRFSAARIADVAARLFRSAANRLPIVMLCDDLQWADDASLDLLDDLTRRLRDVPFVLIGAARTELDQRRPGFATSSADDERIDLAPLTRPAIEEVVLDRLREVPEMPAALVRAVADRAGGYPLAAEEMLHLLVDVGVVVRGEEGAWTVHIDRMGSLTLPSTVRGMVQARLDRLEATARSVLGCAAIFGGPFWDGSIDALREELAGVSGVPAREPTAGVFAELLTGELVRERVPSSFPGEREWVLADTIVQEVAYDMLPRALRRRLHRRAAHWLSARGDGGAQAAAIAHHLDRGGDVRSAAHAHLGAASHAASRGRWSDAQAHIDRARVLFEGSEDASDPPDDVVAFIEERGDARVFPWTERVAFEVQRGDLMRGNGDHEGAERAYEAARARVLLRERRSGVTFEPRDVSLWSARIDFRSAFAAKIRGDLGRARALVERAIEGATAARATAELSSMWAFLGAVLRRSGDLRGALAAQRAGLRACRYCSDRGPQWREAVADLLGALGVLLGHRGLGRPAAAERCCRQAVRFIDPVESPRAAAIAQNTLGAVLFEQGRFAEARDVFASTLRLKKREGDSFELAIAHNNLAEVHLRLGRPDAARRHAARAVRLGEQAQARHDLADAYRNLAEAEAALGALERAFFAAVRALSLASSAVRQEYLSAASTTLLDVCARLDMSPRSPLGSRVRDILGDALLEAPRRAGESPSWIGRDVVVRLEELRRELEPSQEQIVS